MRLEAITTTFALTGLYHTLDSQFFINSDHFYCPWFKSRYQNIFRTFATWKCSISTHSPSGMWCDHFITGYVIDFNPIFNILISSPSSDLSLNTSTHSRVINACIISLTNILPTSSFSNLRYEVVEGHSYIPNCLA